MDIGEISGIGWLHTITSFLATFCGAWNIYAIKGSNIHRIFGRIYVYSVITLSITSFFIFNYDWNPFTGEIGADVFGFFHWCSIATLILAPFLLFTASRQHYRIAAFMHPTAAIVSYYFVLGALINEVFVHVEALRPYALIIVGGKREFGGLYVNLAQTLLLAFMVSILFLTLRRLGKPSAR